VRVRLRLTVTLCMMLAWGGVVYSQDSSYRKAIVGSWESYITNENIIRADAEMHFDNDGTCIRKVTLTNPVSGVIIRKNIQTGTW